MNEKCNFAEVLKKEEETKKKYDYIRFTISDINGVAKSISVPRRHLEEAFENGVFYFQGLMSMDPIGNIAFTREVLENNMGNFRLLPCPNTLHEVPWNGDAICSYCNSDKTKRRIGQVLCEAFWIPPYRNGSHEEGCSRYVLKKQLEKLDKLGLVFKSAFEAEFTVFHRESNKPLFQGENTGSTLRLAQFEDFLHKLEENLFQANIDISSIAVEHGEGQFEFGMKPVDGIKGADTMFLMRQSIKEICQNIGYTATFMAKPFSASTTTALHLNISLWKKDAIGNMINAFHDSLDVIRLSELHRHWIAGLIKHGKAMCAFHCPTSNCYRRMHTFMEPDKIEWGMDDRIAAYRAKSISPSATYVENRLPSGASNPYLVTACTIAAGLDGIIKKLPLPPPRAEQLNLASIGAPVVFKPDTDQDKYFPFTLKDAIDALEKDDVIKEALGEEVIRWFIQVKKEFDIAVIEPLDEKSKWKKELELFYEFL